MAPQTPPGHAFPKWGPRGWDPISPAKRGQLPLQAEGSTGPSMRQDGAIRTGRRSAVGECPRIRRASHCPSECALYPRSNREPLQVLSRLEIGYCLLCRKRILELQWGRKTEEAAAIKLAVTDAEWQ